MPTAPSSRPFLAHVLAPFDAQLPSELSVRQGDFVLVLPNPAPQGWCHVQGSTGKNGLVPWFYLISAAHAELEAATAHLDDDEGLSTDAPASEIKKKTSSSLGVAATAPPGQPVGGEYLEVVAMRGQTGLGLDLDNTNVVRRVSPGSMAAQQGLVKVGDQILEVDGVHLNGGVARGGKSVPMVMAAGQPSYRFRLYRPPDKDVDADALQRDIMSTARLQAIADGLTLPRGANAHMAYVSHSGRQVNADRRNRAKAATRASGRPTHVNELRAWSIAELQSTLRRQLVSDGASKQAGAKALAYPGQRPQPPADAGAVDDEEDLFGQIDKVVQTQKSGGQPKVAPLSDPAGVASAAASQPQPPSPDDSGLRAIAGESIAERDSSTSSKRDLTAVREEVERTIQATLSGGTVPPWVFQEYVERSRRLPASAAQLEELKPGGEEYQAGQSEPIEAAGGALEMASSSSLPATSSTPATAKPVRKSSWFGRPKSKPPGEELPPTLVDDKLCPVPARSSVPDDPKAKYEPSKEPMGAPPLQRPRLVTGGTASGGRQGARPESWPGSSGDGIRLPPRPPEYVATMRMEDMLLAAAEAAAVAAAAGSTNGSVGHTVGGTGIEADEFRQALARYQRHPGVQRKLAEGERAARARREELNRPAYFAERALLPEGLKLNGSMSEAELLAIGATAATAKEVLAKPILRLLRATKVQIEVAKAATLAPLTMDERLTARQARACAYALPEAPFDSSSPEGAMREAWRTAQLKHFEAMEAKGFTCNSPPADDGVDPCASPPARASAASVASSDISVDSHTPASEPPPDTGTPLGSPLSTAPNSTGFKINLAAVKREQVDSTKPLAVPHTPKAEVVARLDKQLAEMGGKSAISSDVVTSGTRSLAAGGAPADSLVATIEISSTIRVSEDDTNPLRASLSWAADKATVEDEAAPIGGVDTRTKLQHRASFKALHARSAADSPYGVVELGEKLGQGTYGAVYRAISNSGKCQTPKGADGMAVKLLKLDAKNALAVAREVEILKQANHSNIVGYYDYFLRPGPDGNEPRLWLFLEFCALGSVLDVMEGQGGPLNEAQAAVVLREVLTALDYMHNELRALHRDVKAANVLLTRTGKVKLGDLGVAAQVYNTMQMRGTMIGTPHWMAPEAFGSVTAIDVSTYDNKVDVWGVGITAIELATMKPPNSELSSVFDIILAIVNGPPPSLSPECGDVLASFVAAALVKDPSARPDAGTLLMHSLVTSANDNALAPIIERGAPAIAPL